MLDNLNEPGRPKLVLHLPGASDVELACGVAAAEAVLYRDGDVDPVDALAANARRDFILYDADGNPIDDMDDEAHRLAALWEQALGAAIDACCAGWGEQPTGGYWLGVNAGVDTVRPWYAESPAAVFKLDDESEGDP